MATSKPSSTTGVRLQKVLADGGWGSRRQCEELILEGRVQIDDTIVQTLGVRVEPQRQKIFVDGQRLKLEKKCYFAIHKPPGVVSTSSDPAGRTRVIDLIPSHQRVYNVGRLDKASEGLIIVTNDGDLANRLTHPRYRVPKIYHVQVQGLPERAALKQLEKGVYLAEGFAKVEHIKIKKKGKLNSELEIILTEGRNREIRRMLAKIGHKVMKLKRVAIGSLRLGELPIGAYRELTRDEVARLRKMAGGSTKQVSKKKVQAKKKLMAKVEEARRKSTKKKTSKKRSSASSTRSATGRRVSKRGAAAKLVKKKKRKSGLNKKKIAGRKKKTAKRSRSR